MHNLLVVFRHVNSDNSGLKGVLFFCLHLVNLTHSLRSCWLSLQQLLYLKVKSYEKHPSFLSTLTAPEMRREKGDHSRTSRRIMDSFLNSRKLQIDTCTTIS
jgi:hypothetical protein